jgi:predicted dehydrogenase
MSTEKIRVGILGCGNIAKPYADDLMTYPQIDLVGVADLDQQRAQDLAAKHHITAYLHPDMLINDPAIDLVVNLTTHHAHQTITTQTLEAGKHVYSEKPLALTPDEAQGLVRLAEQKGKRLGCSPFTLLGEAQQTAWKLVRDGKAGKIRLAYAEVNWGRIEAWHPDPGAFYEVGALFDVGVYPMTILTAMFGPARAVSAYGRVLHPDRLTRQGISFHIETPDYVTASIELEGGVLVRLTTNFYVTTTSKQTGIEFHGDVGSIYMKGWQNFDAAVEFAEFNKPYEPVPLLRQAYQGTPWGRGVQEMAQALIEDRPHRATGAQAAHIVELLYAAAESIRSQQPVQIKSSFTAPAPLEWAI